MYRIIFKNIITFILGIYKLLLNKIIKIKEIKLITIEYIK